MIKSWFVDGQVDQKELCSRPVVVYDSREVAVQALLKQVTFTVR